MDPTEGWNSPDLASATMVTFPDVVDGNRTRMFVESKTTRLLAAASLLVAIVVVASPVQAAESDYTVQGMVTYSDFLEIPVNSSITPTCRWRLDLDRPRHSCL